MREKACLEGEIQRIETSVNDWVEVMENTFWFCTYAKAEFDDADYERKSVMLKALSQNLVLREGDLHIDLLPHLFVLNKGLAT